MKKLILALLLSVSFFSGFAQSAGEEEDDSTLQVMVPRDVFIGDSGQIQYSFRSPVDFFAFTETVASNETMEIDLKAEDFLEDPLSCLVTKTTLSRTGINYNLCITFVPWKTGIIKFRKFNLEEICVEGKENISADFNIELSPVLILSLAEKLGTTTLRPPKAPEVLPYTNYYLWFFLVLAVIVFSLLCTAIIRLPDIIRKWKEIKTRIGFYKNAVKTKRHLNMLLRKKITDADFSEQWQMILREYLEYRFKTPFASVTGKNIEFKIMTVTGGMMGDRQERAVEDLTADFVRTNYIRFASGSIDSKRLPVEEHQAGFMKGEKKSLILSTHKIIDAFEKEDSNG
ncbi:hypothetical protein [Treponema sp.]|uniref:hypothetical protein n=1 Tax=Treponema sp. TaxID=166 RepID=UPI00388D3346